MAFKYCALLVIRVFEFGMVFISSLPTLFVVSNYTSNRVLTKLLGKMLISSNISPNYFACIFLSVCFFVANGRYNGYIFQEKPFWKSKLAYKGLLFCAVILFCTTLKMFAG